MNVLREVWCVCSKWSKFLQKMRCADGKGRKFKNLQFLRCGIKKPSAVLYTVRYPVGQQWTGG